MDLIKIDASQYGLEETKAKQITDMFLPMLQKMEALEEKYNSIIKLPINPDTIAKAKALRLEYVKVRTGTDKIHKELKRFYLQGGKFVDGWKNAQRMASEGIEKNLMNIEKHFENIEKEKRQERLEQRTKILEEYGCTIVPDSLVDMEDEVWLNYLFGVKKNHEMALEAMRKKEEERLRKEKEEEEERKRIQEENERLKKEAEEREKAEQERLKKEAEERRLREAKEEAERKAREKVEAERRKKEEEERKARELELKKEREEKARIEAELQKKKEEEKRLEEEEKARIEAELQKGDIEKVDDLISDLKIIKYKYSFKSNKHKKMHKDVCVLVDKIISHIRKIKLK